MPSGGTRGAFAERHDGAAEAVLRGFAQAILAVGHRADLARSVRARRRLRCPWSAACRAGSTGAPRTTARSAAVSVSRTPPTTLTKTSCASHRNAGVAMQNGQQQRDTVLPRSRPRRGADSRAALASTRRLHLDQHRARAFARDGDGRCPAPGPCRARGRSRTGCALRAAPAPPSRTRRSRWLRRSGS